MKVLITGASGYIGSNLMSALIDSGHEVVALVRDVKRYQGPSNIQAIQADLADAQSLKAIPKDIEAVYYLVHSMKDTKENFHSLEERCINNLLQALKQTQVTQIIYLTGLISSKLLSQHLTSRLHVEKIIKDNAIPYTIFRAGVVIGSKSASFIIMRDLIHKLPIMVAPKWVNNRCQPISIKDAIYYLSQSLGKKECFNKVFDIGGPEAISYKDMLIRLAKVFGKKRYIITLPVLTPKLSSYWLYFITAANFILARSLVESLTCDAVCENHEIDVILPHKCLSYEESIELTFHE